MSKPHDLGIGFLDYVFCSVRFQKVVYYFIIHRKCSFLLAPTHLHGYQSDPSGQRGSGFLLHQEVKKPYDCIFMDDVHVQSQLEL